MRSKIVQTSTTFPKLDRVIRSQRWLTIMNTFVTVLFFSGVAAAAASSLTG
jgi:hypothetical protein